MKTAVFREWTLDKLDKAFGLNQALAGVVDGMIGKGFRTQGLPYFCMHEYKRGMDHDGNPDGQAFKAIIYREYL